jgi:transposase-like protein
MYVRFSLSLRNVEDLLHERGVEIIYETVRFLVAPVLTDVRGRDPEGQMAWSSPKWSSLG